MTLNDRPTLRYISFSIARCVKANGDRAVLSATQKQSRVRIDLSDTHRAHRPIRWASEHLTEISKHAIIRRSISQKRYERHVVTQTTSLS